MRERRRTTGPTLAFVTCAAQPTDDRQIAAAVLVAKVGQQAGPLADHLQQAAPAGVVLLVRAHVLVQLVDAMP